MRYFKTLALILCSLSFLLFSAPTLAVGEFKALRSNYPIRSDEITEILMGISTAHSHIHHGDSFVVTDVQNLSTTTVKWMVTTPNVTRWAHMLIDIDCTGEMQILITEGADRIGTTTLISHNRNRNNTTTNAGLVIHRGTSGGTTDGATALWTHRSGASSLGALAASPGQARGEEFVLKQNTKYVIAVTTYANVYVTFDLDWYEHTDRN